jgi:beta-glucanase (GH16 family)
VTKRANRVKSVRRGSLRARTKGNNKFFIVVILFGLIGGAIIIASNAASPYAQTEVENAVLSGGSSMINDVNASGGKAVVFQAGSNPGTGQKCSQLTNLKFCDDFDGPAGTLPDSTKWNVFASGSSWGSQCWKKLPENISMDGQGNLKQTIIDKGTTQCTNYYDTPSPYTSGGMDTSGRFTTKFGKFEVRAKLACAASVWGAIWTATGTGPAWPRSGEIDIYEITGNRYSKLKQTIFIPSVADPSKAKSVSTYVDLPTGQRWCDEFHVYGLDWRKDSLQFTVDGQNKARLTPASLPSDATWPFNDYDQRLLIDLQYGQTGKFTGDPIPSQLPSSMLIDYVRVYN